MIEIALDNSSSRQITVAVIAAGIIYGIAALVPKLLFTAVVPKIATTQAIELGLSLVAIALLGRGKFADYGFRMPKPDRSTMAALMRWIPTGLLAIAIGAATSIAMLATGANGNPLIKALTPPQVFLFVFILSSTVEEIFMRGFLQSHIAIAMKTDPAGKPPFLDCPTVISAAAFAGMHLVLIAGGADWKTVVIILAFTFSLGLVAGRQRARSGSLVPAIGAHMLGNVGGLVGGIIYTIISVASGHGIPGQ